MSMLKLFAILIAAAALSSCGATTGLDSYDRSVTSEEFYATCDVTVVRLPEGAETPSGGIEEVTYTQPLLGPMGGIISPEVDCSELEIIYSVRKDACARGANAAVITFEHDPVRNGYCYTCVVNYYNVTPADDWFVALTRDAEAMKRYSYYNITSRMEVNEDEADRKDSRETLIAVAIGTGLIILAGIGIYNSLPSWGP
ncbi:hypothetical protein F8C67_13880 [Phaeocystidibacter luteus]|uniref:Lipoprotein n=2 Tax=Phaeocystidibacter luteus TaxID=911197 RepID=A0A6N6RFA3_9FLAO|nr:hypothetical protein F8C67_13880 [Phaeocystidibacter luteus]